MYVAKTKALISFAVTAKLICVFVFAYAKSRFSNDAARIIECNYLNVLTMKANALIRLGECTNMVLIVK